MREKNNPLKGFINFNLPSKQIVNNFQKRSHLTELGSGHSSVCLGLVGEGLIPIIFIPQDITYNDVSREESPGTLISVDVDAGKICVACNPGSVEISGLNLKNQEKAVLDFLALLNGKQLPLFSAEELSWINEWGDSCNTSLEYSIDLKPVLYEKHTITVRCEKIEQEIQDRTNPLELIALVAATCWRLSPMKNISIGCWWNDQYRSVNLNQRHNNWDSIKAKIYDTARKSVKELDAIKSFVLNGKGRFRDFFPLAINIITQCSNTKPSEHIYNSSLLLWEINTDNTLIITANPLLISDEHERSAFLEMFDNHLVKLIAEIESLVTANAEILNTPFSDVVVGYAPEDFVENEIEAPTQLEVKRQNYPMLVGSESECITRDALASRVSILQKAIDQKINDRNPILIYLPFGKAWLTVVTSIITSGRTYVPLKQLGDTGFSLSEQEKKYLDHVKKITGASCLITTSEYGVNLENDKDLTLIFINDLMETKNGAQPGVVLHTQESFNEKSAYHVLTSGSTGMAKAVDVSYGAILQSTKARAEYYRDKSRHKDTPHVILALTDTAFDVTTGVVWWALYTGSSLVHIPNDKRTDGEYILDLIIKHKVSHLVSTPEQYIKVLEKIGSLNVDSLEAVILGGEKWSDNLIKMHRKVLLKTRLFNEYGPSECTVYCSVEEVDINSDDIVGIGKPIVPARFRVFDEDGGLVLPGIKGELHVSGPILAKGYSGDPGRTESAFKRIKKNSSASSGKKSKERYYKTGDLVYWHPKKETFVFSDRIADEIKLNGLRFDPSIIKDVIKKTKWFSDIRLIPTSDKQLILLLRQNQFKNVENLSKKIYQLLRANIDADVIPLIYINHEFPLTSNGKIDVKNVEDAMKSSDKDLQEKYQYLMQFWSHYYSETMGSDPEQFKQLIEEGRSITHAGLDSLGRVRARKVFKEQIESDGRFKLKAHQISDILKPNMLLQQAKMWQELDRSQALFITGVTGFVGSALLLELLKHRNNPIYVMVRCPAGGHDQKEKENLIVQYWRALNLSDSLCEDYIRNNQRIRFVQGNLEEENWGLDENTVLQELDEVGVQEVYHCAAEANHEKSVDQLRRVNTGSLKTLLFNLAPRWLHPKILFVSTLATNLFRHRSDDQLNGYVLTKKEAETLCVSYRNEYAHYAADIRIVRPGWVIPSYKTGVFPKVHSKTDHFYCLLKSFVAFKVMPNFSKKVYFDFIPVDFLSAFIEQFTSTDDSLSKNSVLNLGCRFSWSDLMILLQKENKLPNPIIDMNVINWVKRIRVNLKEDAKNPLSLFSSIYENNAGFISALEEQCLPEETPMSENLLNLWESYKTAALNSLKKLIDDLLMLENGLEPKPFLQEESALQTSHSNERLLMEPRPLVMFISKAEAKNSTAKNEVLNTYSADATVLNKGVEETVRFFQGIARSDKNITITSETGGNADCALAITSIANVTDRQKCPSPHDRERAEDDTLPDANETKKSSKTKAEVVIGSESGAKNSRSVTEVGNVRSTKPDIQKHAIQASGSSIYDMLTSSNKSVIVFSSTKPGAEGSQSRTTVACVNGLPRESDSEKSDEVQNKVVKI